MYLQALHLQNRMGQVEVGRYSTRYITRLFFDQFRLKLVDLVMMKIGQVYASQDDSNSRVQVVVKLNPIATQNYTSIGCTRRRRFLCDVHNQVPWQGTKREQSIMGLQFSIPKRYLKGSRNETPGNFVQQFSICDQACLCQVKWSRHNDHELLESTNVIALNTVPQRRVSKYLESFQEMSMRFRNL